MIGAIIGDIVGSRFEFVEDLCRPKDFALFTRTCRPTDDSFMTLAVAEALLLAKGDREILKKQDHIIGILLRLGMEKLLNIYQL